MTYAGRRSSSSHRLTRWITAGALAMAMFSSAALALDAQQEAVNNQASSTLKAAEADLESARSSAGTAERPATGSRLRLTQMRLSSATQRLAQAQEILATLPADDEAVKANHARHAAAAEVANQINAILNPPKKDEPAKEEPSKEPAKAEEKKDGESAAASQPAADKPAAEKPATAKPAPAAKPARLGYQQEDLLKNARFNLRDAQGRTTKVTAVVAQLDAKENAPVHRDVVNALEVVQLAQTKIKHAQDTLDKLPADHPQVAEVIAEAKATRDTLAANQSRLSAAELSLGKLAKIENYPDYNKDASLLSDLTRRYYDFNQAVQQPQELALVIREDGQALKEIQRIARTYLPLVQQKTAEGEAIEKRFDYFQSKRGSFAQALMEYKKQLPALFQADLDNASKLAQEAVAKKMPAYFGPESGIAQNFGFAQDKLLVIEAFGEKEAAPYKEKLEATRTDIAAKGKALEEQIITTNTLPPDNYKGDDRDAIIAIAKDGWSYQQKDAPVLMARIPSQAWTRETRWEWFSGGFHKVDVSRIQVQLVIKHDGRLAVIQPINVKKDHLKGDTLTGHPMRDGQETPPPQSFMLLEKVK